MAKKFCCNCIYYNAGYCQKHNKRVSPYERCPDHRWRHKSYTIPIFSVPRR